MKSNKFIISKNMENIESEIKKEDSAIIQIKTNASADTSLKDLLNPKSPFQWIAFLVLITGVIGGGAIGGGLGALAALKIFNLDKTACSTGKKLLLSLLYITLGIIGYVVVYLFLASLFVEYLPAE